MEVIALVSGGKDSCYNMMKCVENGHTIVCLANLYPPEGTDELDSYMYQTVGHEAIHLYAEAMGLPLHRRVISGKPLCKTMEYTVEMAGFQNGEKIDKNAKISDEVEDLYELLKELTEKYPGVGAVSVGAIFSDYQRIRVQNICQRLNIKMLAYLWHRDQVELFDEMVKFGVHAILIKTAAMGLDPRRDLGRNLAEMREKLQNLKEKFQINVCGEGGEFETFVLDCPLFKKKILLDQSETCIHSNDAFAPVGYLKMKKLHLEDKN